MLPFYNKCKSSAETLCLAAKHLIEDFVGKDTGNFSVSLSISESIAYLFSSSSKVRITPYKSCHNLMYLGSKY